MVAAGPVPSPQRDESTRTLKTEGFAVMVIALPITTAAVSLVKTEHRDAT